MKYKVLIVGFLMLSTSLNAKHLNAGSAMCKTESAMRQVVESSRSNNFWNVWGKLTAQGLCAESAMTMRNSSSLKFENLYGGVTKVGNLYFVTGDIR